jgi:hypothetical protein
MDVCVCVYTHTHTHIHTYTHVWVPSWYFSKMVESRPFLNQSTSLAHQSIGYALLEQWRRGQTTTFPLAVNALPLSCHYFLAFSLLCLRLDTSILSSYTDTCVCQYVTIQRGWLAALTLITNYLSCLTVCLSWHTRGRRAAAATSLTLLLCV